MSRLAALAQSLSLKFKRTDWEGFGKKWGMRGLTVCIFYVFMMGVTEL